ncbi:g9a isoform b [Holotrichia oblita]|uniref:G9a isoform b n=1 Tax=Holotrichia oblita TaxID=644536 RepID=A0ACB9SZ88_HOLOL|nr:g9a isoform b [Holotrichia oblita]
MDSEVVGADTDESNTFITKLIVEMKNTFNKTEKKLISPESESTTDTKTPASPEVTEHMNETNLDNMVVESSNNEIQSVPDEVISQENNEEVNIDAVPEEAVNSAEITEEENKSDNKPRLVMHFRKPLNSAAGKAKGITNNVKSHKSLRNKIQETQLKRSARRRISRDGESVLQSAIARKEKSYNEAAKPQRLTRQLKLTPKILENLSQNQLKEKSKNKSTKAAEKQSTENDVNVNMIQTNVQMAVDEKNKKHKLKTANSEKQTKRTNKRLKSNQSDSKDSDNDQNVIIKDSEINEYDKNDLKIAGVIVEERRRSQRKSTSRYKEEEISNVEDAEAQEASIAEEESMYPAHPECSSVGAELIASKLCLCTKPSQIYSSENDKELFCTAVDSVGDKLVGCNNLVENKERPMFRMSTRVPYGIYCEVHRNRMIRHNCCPTCGVFCTQGRFVECELKHHYHRNCQIVVGDVQCCPHCGRMTPEHDVIITMYSTNRPVFLTKQRIFHPPAKITFPSKNNYDVKRSESPLLPPNMIEIPSESNALYDNCDIAIIFDVIKQKDYKSFANILGSKSVSMISTVTDNENVNVIHYCAKHGHLPAMHMLLVAGIELDLLDKDQNTPLMVAVLSFKNDIVKYLIKAGANISFKGTDGMTALHLAAEWGNLESCELLVEAATNKQEYINCADDGGWTALVWACEHNHLNIVKYLLRKGADPSLRDLKQNIALHWAAFSGCQENVELLLNYGTDVNVVNAQGDTPFDISNGKEINPIQCINVLDSEAKPINFVYVTDYCVTSDINIDNKITSLHSCTCGDNCTVTDCSCVRNSLTNWYDEDGRLVPHFDFADAPLIFECNQMCSCNALTCNNRVVQRGLMQRFQLFRIEKKGWGIKTLNAIVKGSFVCEYIGEIVNDVDADQREDDSYFFGLDSHEESFSIDARKYGNFGRFLNHSCSPNLTPIKVFTNHQDLRFPRIALFANRDILAEEELCFDYGEKFWSVKSKLFQCACGSSNCTYSKEILEEIIDEQVSSKD